MQVPTMHPTRLILAAAVLLMAAVAPRPAGAQGSYVCQTHSPVEFCDDEESVCVSNYKDCFFDWDGLTLTGYEQTVLFFQNAGTETNPPFGVGDRHCFQGEDFNPDQDDPDSGADQYGILRFALVLPVGNEEGPFPLLVMPRGAAAGWVDTAAASQSHNAWTLEFSDPDTSSYEKGKYEGQLHLAQGVFAEGVLLDYLLDDDGLAAKLRDDEDWAILFPSGCSHDAYNGRGSLAGNSDFLEAARTRFGFDSVVEALQIVDDEYGGNDPGIEYLFVAGTSGGGTAAFLFADDLVGAASEFDGRFRGAIMDSAPAEWDDWADLYALGTEIDVDNDDICTDPDEATVPCEHPAEPLASAFAKTGASGRSASADIQAGTAVPILHVWDRRDTAHCYDYCYSRDFLHGPIATAIDDRKVGDIDEHFEFSENLEFCAGSCRAGENGPIVECTRHGSLGERSGAPIDGVLACALDWIDEVNEHWEDDLDGYETPASCVSSIEEDLSSSPPLCTDQGTIM